MDWAATRRLRKSATTSLDDQPVENMTMVHLRHDCELEQLSCVIPSSAATETQEKNGRGLYFPYMRSALRR